MVVVVGFEPTTRTAQEIFTSGRNRLGQPCTPSVVPRPREHRRGDWLLPIYRDDHAGIPCERRRAVVGHLGDQVDRGTGFRVLRDGQRSTCPVGVDDLDLARVRIDLAILPPPKRELVAVRVGRPADVERDRVARCGNHFEGRGVDDRRVVGVGVLRGDAPVGPGGPVVLEGFGPTPDGLVAGCRRRVRRARRCCRASRGRSGRPSRPSSGVRGSAGRRRSGA